MTRLSKFLALGAALTLAVGLAAGAAEGEDPATVSTAAQRLRDFLSEIGATP